MIPFMKFIKGSIFVEIHLELKIAKKPQFGRGEILFVTQMFSNQKVKINK